MQAVYTNKINWAPCTIGSYEVHFYDGFKKVVHRVNIKPDNRVSAFENHL